MRRVALIAMVAAACGSSNKSEPPAAETKTEKPAVASDAAVAVTVDAAVAAPVTPTPAAPPPIKIAKPAKDLLDAVPADAAFAIAMLEPVDDAAWARVRGALEPVGLRQTAEARMQLVVSPIDRLVEAGTLELAAALASGDAAKALGLPDHPRAVAYARGDVIVVRAELADAGATEKAIARAMAAADAKTARQGAEPIWRIEDRVRGLEVAITGTQLVVAVGARDALRAHAGEVLGAADTPATADTFKALAADRKLVGPVGWLDPKALAAVMPDLTSKCRDALTAYVSAWPRLSVGFHELSAARATLELTVDPEAATMSALVAAGKDASGLPDELAGSPWFAVSFAGAATAGWPWSTAGLLDACGDSDMHASVAPPWNTMRAAAFGLYDLELDGFSPKKLDAYLAIQATDAPAIETQIRAALAGVPMLSKVAVKRAKDTVAVTAGATGIARAADFVPRPNVPLLRLAVDIDKIKAATSPALGGKLDDAQYYRATGTGSEDATIGHASIALVGRVDSLVTLDGPHVRVSLSLGLRAPAPVAPDTDPRAPIRRQCVALLHRAFASARPAIVRLGLEADVGQLLEGYLEWGDGFVRECAALEPAKRACFDKAPSPIAANEACTGSGGLFFPLLLGPRTTALEQRLAPPAKDPAALKRKLVGTWVQKKGLDPQTLVIDAHAEAIADNRVKVTRDRVTTTEDIYLADATHLYRGYASPIASETDFVANLPIGYLVVDASGCVVVSGAGLVVPATCTVKPVDAPIGVTGAKRKLEVAFASADAPYQKQAVYFADGWVLGEDIIDSEPYIKQ